MNLEHNPSKILTGPSIQVHQNYIFNVKQLSSYGLFSHLIHIIIILCLIESLLY